jgi:hypothetical protein
MPHSFLPRYKPLRSAGALNQTPMSESVTGRLRRSERIYALAKAVVRLRSGDRCEICGARATQHQHRIRRGMGGSSRNPLIHRVSSLLHVCDEHAYAADHDPDRYDFGWSVHRGQDTATVPVRLADGWYLLDDEGGRHAAPNGGGAA